MQYDAMVSAKSVHSFKILAVTSVPDHCVAQDKPPGHISCNSSALQVTPIISSSLARGDTESELQEAVFKLPQTHLDYFPSSGNESGQYQHTHLDKRRI